MGAVNGHWTNSSTEDFLYRIGFDYISQIQQAMEADGVSQAKLAKALKLSEGRVSQVLNNPGNLTLRKIIEYARALGKKVAIVAYDDHDPENQSGPVNAQVFAKCWENAGSPADFFEMSDAHTATGTTSDMESLILRKLPGRETQYLVAGAHRANTEFNPDVSYGGPSETGVTEHYERNFLYGRG
jgi:transcriptional regulator with XRE-family HTH domain